MVYLTSEWVSALVASIALGIPLLQDMHKNLGKHTWCCPGYHLQGDIRSSIRNWGFNEFLFCLQKMLICHYRNFVGVYIHSLKPRVVLASGKGVCTVFFSNLRQMIFGSLCLLWYLLAILSSYFCNACALELRSVFFCAERLLLSDRFPTFLDLCIPPEIRVLSSERSTSRHRGIACPLQFLRDLWFFSYAVSGNMLPHSSPNVLELLAIIMRL